MAIARKIDPAAMARAFADEVSAIPEVKRLWYHADENPYIPDTISLSFYVLQDPDTDASFAAIADALTYVQERHFEEAVMSAEIIQPWQIESRGLDYLLVEGSVEIPLRRV